MKQLIAFDLDGALAERKQAIDLLALRLPLNVELAVGVALMSIGVWLYMT